MAASFFFLFFEIILAEPAVSALTYSFRLFFLINFEHCESAWACEYTVLISEILASG